jgi:DNA-binding Lrp family transcriptional regulator
MQAALLQADVPISDLSKQLGLREHTVRHALSGLIENKIFLSKVPFLNISVLGLVRYMMFISVVGISQKKREEFLKEVCAYDHVGFVAEVGGDFQYEIWFYTRDSRDFVNFIDELGTKLKIKIHTHEIAIIHEEEYSGPRYVIEGAPKIKPLRAFPVGSRMEIDEINHKIIYFCSNEGILSRSELSNKLKIPASTLGYRIADLEKKGLIVGYYYICDIKPLQELPFSFLIYSTALCRSTREKLCKFCAEHRKIAYLQLTVGFCSARVFARVEGYEQARMIAHELYDQFSKEIDRVRIMPQLKFYKCTDYPFRNLESVIPI